MEIASEILEYIHNIMAGIGWLVVVLFAFLMIFGFFMARQTKKQEMQDLAAWEASLDPERRKERIDALLAEVEEHTEILKHQRQEFNGQANSKEGKETQSGSKPDMDPTTDA